MHKVVGKQTDRKTDSIVVRKNIHKKVVNEDSQTELNSQTEPKLMTKKVQMAEQATNSLD